jgi:hypothetical protein
MATIWKLAMAALAIAAFSFATPATAQSDLETGAHTIIQKQMDAFAHDDAAGAYELAAPGIQSMFTDPSTFLSMVRNAYAPVYRHRSADFGAFQGSDDAVMQTVTIIDQNGELWTALYKLGRQPDGQWKITGCILAKVQATES